MNDLATSGAVLPAQPAAGAEGALGNNADFVPTPPFPEGFNFLPAPGTVRGFHLRHVGRDLLKSNGIERRMRWCGSRIERGSDGVNLYARPDRANGRVSGVCVCGQSICCPVCAPRIAARRAGEVEEAFRMMSLLGYEVRLETFSKPHYLDSRPNALLKEFRSFAGLWRSYQHHADRRERGAAGSHVGREVTWGEKNGWNYHHHRLRYDEQGKFSPDRARAQWLAVLDGVGLRVRGAEEHAYDAETVGDEAGARYVAKLATMVDAQARSVGREVASGVTKGRSINSLLADFAAGDLPSGATWVNGVACVTATKISSVRWSRGLRDAVGLGNEKSDAELAKDEVLPSDVFLGSLNAFQWQGLLRERCELVLLCAANRGRDEVNELLSGLSLGLLDDEDPRLAWRKSNQEGF